MGKVAEGSGMGYNFFTKYGYFARYFSETHFKLTWIYTLYPVLGIRIRMFLGLPDPVPFFRGPDPALDTDPSLFSFSHKGVELTEKMLAK
jgi:hypothetical protein